MADLYFSKFSLLFCVLFLQVEILFFYCYNHIIFFSKILKIGKTYENTKNFSFGTITSYINIFLVLALVFNKEIEISNFMFTGILLLSVLNFTVVHIKLKEKIYSFFIPLILIFVTTSLLFVESIDSFLKFFFLIEIYGVLYYFCFLTTFKFSNFTFLKYKNSILLLLWNNFLTTFFLALSCFFLTVEYGTSSYDELRLLIINPLYIYIFFLGIAWKLGLPLFHFFKLEIYKFLIKENVFFFSILTTAINFVLLSFFFSIQVVYDCIYLHNILFLLILFSLNIILINLKLYNILGFLAISSILTLSTVLTLFML